jgi:hypothetical protein
MRRVIIGWGMAAILLAVLVGIAWVWNLARQAPTSPVRAHVVQEPARPAVPTSGNPANDHLATLPSTEQALLLGRAVGADCQGTMAFPMGIGRRDADRGDAYWSVRCADGASYAVAIHPDKGGSTTVFNCNAVKAAGLECFKRIPEQTQR